MKIAAAALSDKERSRICSNPLRTPFFLLFDEAGIFLDSLWNPFRTGGGSAGYGIAQILMNERADCLITGSCPAETKKILKEYGIRVIIDKGEALSAVEKYRSQDAVSQPG